MPHALPLAFLDFDYTEDEDGNGSFDALASAAPAQLSALQAEVLRVLAWAGREFAGAQGPLEAGGEWDFALQGVSEVATPLDVAVDDGTLRLDPGTPGAPRVTLSLTLSGTPAFCAAFREAFGLG
ncbi:hypothetical protein [Ramlibacter rhizophilus]|uniref:Uncharacterized protein n=1 Tax=Ramlibacter rhizophilus TaxID=1781167 RepID=A0A4Z0C0J4_9BURK|nr:hypothetical protein [Ramlibacter rhizophilus]TFZ04324.1 hypothetical protein EZ242_00760 [Ramlibacter rhizophilus]